MSKNKQFGADADMLIWPKSDAITKNDQNITLNLQYYVLVRWDWNDPNI